MRIVVLMGGTSAEREISLKTGAGIAASLRQRKHEVTAIDTADGAILLPGTEIDRPLPAEIGGARSLVPRDRAVLAETAPVHDADVIFLALHGGAGEDGTMQALLELAGKPYTGSGMLASALAMDKAMSKRLFEHAGIPTPPWRLYHVSGPVRPTAGEVGELGGFPIVVKPNDQGSTVGLTIVREPGELEAAFAEAARYTNAVLLEAYVPGRELTVSVLGEETLPVIEIVPEHGLYDFECKYTPGMSRYECPAQLAPELTARVQELGLRACRTLGTAGVARVDFRLAPDDTPYCLEVNTIPGMTATSLVPMAAKVRGISFEELCERIASLALRRFEAEHGPIPGIEPPSRTGTEPPSPTGAEPRSPAAGSRP